MGKFVSTAEMLANIQDLAVRSKTQREAARQLGISAAYLSDILAGRRELSAEVGAKLGYKRVVVWERTEDG